MAALTYRELLAGNRSFRNLWAGQVVSELGNWFNFIAGLGLVRAVSGAAPEATAMLVVLRLAPFAVFAPIAGALVDRWSRRTVMIASDIARAVFALGFLLVRGPEDLWIAYACTAASTLLAAFFEGAKNAALPNVIGDRGLLAGNALMFSSRFLLMSVGAALGGTASAWLGYEIAFVVNALSFLASAYSISHISEREMRAEGDGADDARPEARSARGAGRLSVLSDVRDGWAYIIGQPLVAAIIGINILWATGGGALNLIYDRLGGVVFAGEGGLSGDAAVAAIYTVVGVGLFIGMALARRVGSHVEMRGATPAFIGWALIAHGLFFALAGLMPTLWTACLLMMLSRIVVGVEFAVQETLLMRLLPDSLRGRVSTTDRAAEIMMMSISTVVAGELLHGWLTPRTLAVASGLLSATPGVMWLLLFASGKLRMPPRREGGEEGERAVLASPAG
jgi:MFS family permease